MRRMICILTITAIILIGTVAAAPVIPDEFYGSVYLNGNPAPAGTVIIAKLNGEPRGEFTTTVEGMYGSPGTMEPRLTVAATEDEIISGNATITFFVSGVQAFQVVSFKSGNSEKLDLLANSRAFGNETNIPVTSSSGGSSGGFVSPVPGTGQGTASGGSIQGTSVSTPTTESRSSIYYNIDATPSTRVTSVSTTAITTQSPAVTTVPTTKKAGGGPLSVVFIVASVIAVLCIACRADVTGKQR